MAWFNRAEPDNIKQVPNTEPVQSESLSEPNNTEQRQLGEVFRDRLKDGSKGPEMVMISAGEFRMGDIQGTGDDDEKPVHKVSIKSFAMGRYPVTVAEFRQFVAATGYKTEAETGDGAYVRKDGKWQTVKDANWHNPYFPKEDKQPVVCVSWNDAVAYTQWLSEQTGQQYHLPTEAQWEYAARAGTETDYWWGNEINKSQANYNMNLGQTSPVGDYEPNPFGLYDTVGNVWEWCTDNWHENYKGAPTDWSVWKGGDGSIRVLRGGSWAYCPGDCRTALRLWYASDYRFQLIWFRVAVAVRL